MSLDVPESGLTTAELAVLANFRRELADALDEAIASAGGGEIGGIDSLTATFIPASDGDGGFVDSSISDDGVAVGVVRSRFYVDNGEAVSRLQLASSLGANYIQSGVNGTANSAAPLYIGSMGNGTNWVAWDASGNVSFKKNFIACPSSGQTFTVGNGGALDAVMSVWGSIESGKFTGTAVAGGFYNFIATDYSNQALGTGGSYKMQGPYTDAGDIIGAAEIKASKSSGVSGEVGHDLLFATKTTGGVGFDVRLAIRQTGLEVLNSSGGSAYIFVGTGDPESVVAATVGSLFLRTDGGASTTLYVKTSGSGSTGWTAK